MVLFRGDCVYVLFSLVFFTVMPFAICHLLRWLLACLFVVALLLIVSNTQQSARKTLQHLTINIQAWTESDGLQAQNEQRKHTHTHTHSHSVDLIKLVKICAFAAQRKHHGLSFAFDRLHRWTATNLINIYQYMWEIFSMPFSCSIRWTHSFGKVIATYINIKIDFRKIEGEREAIFTGWIGGKRIKCWCAETATMNESRQKICTWVCVGWIDLNISFIPVAAIMSWPKKTASLPPENTYKHCDYSFSTYISHSRGKKPLAPRRKKCVRVMSTF